MLKQFREVRKMMSITIQKKIQIIKKHNFLDSQFFSN